MTTALWTAVAAVVFLANLAAHEAAHALALHRLGGNIREAGLGLPLPPRLVLKSTRRRSFALSFSPWLLGAYVTPDDESVELLKKASYRDRAWFAGAGVVVNLVTGALGAAVLLAIRGLVLPAATAAVVGALVWCFRKAFVAYVMIPAGLAAVTVVVWSLVLAAQNGDPAGPLAIPGALVSTSAIDVLVINTSVALSLAVLNMVPIYPFDGGRVADAAIDVVIGPRASSSYQAATAVVALGFLAYLVVSDVVLVVREQV